MTREEQVETIKTMVGNAGPVDERELDRLLMPFILDMSYDRAAICQARKELLGVVRVDH